MRTTLPSSLHLLGLVLCGLVLSACFQEPEVSQEPEVLTGPFLIRDGITYDQNTNEPVTGIVEEFDEGGQLLSRGNYIDGEQNGLYEEFYENGQLSERGNYIDGLQDGLFEMFHENGQLQYRGNYTDGLQDGLVEFFDEDGNLSRTRTYRNGVLVE